MAVGAVCPSSHKLGTYLSSFAAWLGLPDETAYRASHGFSLLSFLADARSHYGWSVCVRLWLVWYVSLSV